MGTSQSVLHHAKAGDAPPTDIIEKLEQGAEIARTAQLFVSREEADAGNVVTKLVKVVLDGKQYSEDDQVARSKAVWLEPGDVAVSFSGSHIVYSTSCRCLNSVTDESEHIKILPYLSSFTILTSSSPLHCASIAASNPDATLLRSAGIHHHTHPYGTFFLVFVNTSENRAYLGETFFNDYRGVANIKLSL